MHLSTYLLRQLAYRRVFGGFQTILAMRARMDTACCGIFRGTADYFPINYRTSAANAGWDAGGAVRFFMAFLSALTSLFDSMLV